MNVCRRKILSVLLSLCLAAGSSLLIVYAESNVKRQEESSIDYILGRPMTEAEIEEQEAMVPELAEMPLPDELVEPVQTEARARASEASQLKRFDLREEGLVTSVKNQVVDGPCWAFAEAALAESSVIWPGMDVEPDLSEEHLAYFFYNRQNDPLGNTRGDRNVASNSLASYKSVGGNLQLASKFLSTWSGAASEAAFPYSVSSSGLDDSLAYEAEVHLQNARFMVSSVEEIKEAIYSQRKPVGVTYYHDNSCWNKETAAYCCPVSKSINHAVTIVGWDDDYSKDNFLPAGNVVSDGAWIVKNSWGQESGDEGYIYISYEDKSIQGAVSADFEPADNYDHNYQYDGSSGSNSIRVLSGASHASVFQVKGNPSGSEILKAAGMLVNSAHTDLSIDVYTELQDPSDPSSGIHTVDSQQEGTTYSGYYTFVLDQEVPLREGSYFSVIFTNCSDEEKSFAIESAADSGWIKFETGVESGQSFYRAGASKNWQDMDGNYLSSKKAVNARIKAYTIDSQEILEEPDISGIPGISGEPDISGVPDISGEPDISGVPDTPDVTPTKTPVETKIPEETKAPEGSQTPAVTPTDIPVPVKVVINRAVSAKKKITLKWNRVSGADSYEVYRKKGSSGSWTQAADTAKASYVDKGLAAASVYRYRVRAVQKQGRTLHHGAYSEILKAVTKPAAPEKISIKAVTKAKKKTKAQIAYRVSARASGYEIYQYDRKAKKYQPAYRIHGAKVYIYQKAKHKYKKIGTAKKSGKSLTAVLTKIDLKTYKKQHFKIQAYVDADGCARQYSDFSGKITLK